jgi:triosephosphate isomerase
MNKKSRESTEFLSLFPGLIQDLAATAYEVAIAPQMALIELVARQLLGKPIAVAAQNCGTARSGAFTGEVSPALLKELGVRWVILGHSERRHVFHEPDALVLARLKAAWEEGLKPVLCVGEQLADRKAGKAFEVVANQLGILREPGLEDGIWEDLVIAYEPVWAIGTGENATPQQAEEVQFFIREWLAKHFPGAANRVRVLYGGSVKAENAASLMSQPSVDGLLVGNASLDATTFAGVVRNGLMSRGKIPGGERA